VSGPGRPFDTKIEERARLGGPVGVVLEVAQQVDADLLAVGSVGLDTLVGRVFGSVARAVSRRANTEVLIVPTTATPLRLRSARGFAATRPARFPRPSLNRPAL
jgi:nucleotide-binding universal stress UspA family protein